LVGVRLSAGPAGAVGPALPYRLTDL